MVLSKLLSYDCTKHIIKHTDPNTRISLSIRCPSLKAIEKTMPFKCQKLKFTFYRTSINDVDYQIDMIYDNLEPFLQLTVKHQYREYVGKVRDETSFLDPRRCINHFLFGGRSGIIRVNHLQINVDISRLPESVKFHSKEVDTRITTADGFEQLKKIMAASSFPLNYCGIGYINNDWSTLEHPVFRSACCVFIKNEESNQAELFRRILELPHGNITVQSRLTWTTLQTIIDNWKTTQRKVGTSLTIDSVHTEEIEKILNQILQEEQYRENKNGDFIIPLHQDKNLRISYGDTHKELPINGRCYKLDMRNGKFKRFLQFTVKYQDQEYVERIQPKGHMESFFWNYVNSFLFGGRSGPIRVKRLQTDVDILRLPKFVKFHCKEVDTRITTADEFEQLKKIMDASSFPLNFCGIRFFANDWSTFEHPLFRSARHVFIRNKYNNQPELFRRLLELPNGNITVQSCLSWITFQMIMENWKTTQRKVGTSLTIERVHTDDVENILNQILQEGQYRENKNGDFIIPLHQDRNLRISYGDTHEELPRNPRLWNSFKNFLKLEVIDVDSG
ncbi:unnamed protein product [Caenorhabditis nigoni]